MSSSGTPTSERATGTAARATYRIRPASVADSVAAVLRERIIEGELVDGTLLPKQEDLMDQFSVSRQSLRSALGILEKEGLVTVQRGSVGGVRVHLPTPDSSAYTFGMILQSRHVPLDDLAEALRHLEPVAASILATRRTPDILHRLRSLTEAAEEAVSDPATFTRLSREFHKEIVANCGNETIRLLAGTLETLWSDQIQEWAERADRVGAFPDVSVRHSALATHRKLLEAFAVKNAQRAYKIALAHLGRSQTYLLSDGPTRRVKVAGFRAPAPSTALRPDSVLPD